MPAAARLTPRRLAPVLVLAAITALVFALGWAMGWHRHVSVETLAEHRAALGAFVAAHYAAALLGFMALYVAWVSLSIPWAFVLSIAAGALFGTVVGGLAVVVAATVGATIIFLIARSAFSGYVVRRAGPRLSRIMDSFRADAFSYLLFLRLVPAFPFVLVNLAPALVGVRLPVFIAATVIGIMPASFVFALVGDGFDSLLRDENKWKLICALLALALLSLVPVVVKRVFMRRTNPPAERGCGPDA
jgi:uncharacterized membrane protein YdjX (TVP38/TMEM64 family)